MLATRVLSAASSCLFQKEVPKWRSPRNYGARRRLPHCDSIERRRDFGSPNLLLDHFQPQTNRWSRYRWSSTRYNSLTTSCLPRSGGSDEVAARYNCPGRSPFRNRKRRKAYTEKGAAGQLAPPSRVQALRPC